MNNEIPKTIHYCWFGKNLEPELMKKCIDSWKKYLPDYQIVRWDEDSFDILSHPFVKDAYAAKKWAFVTDYVRFFALYNCGGIYMDTDVEVLKPLDIFLQNPAFTGYENDIFIPTGIIGSQQKNAWVKDILEFYDTYSFIKEDGSFSLQPNTVIITELTTRKYGFKREKGYQVLKESIVLYPKEYFCPKSYYDGSINITENTYTIHHFSGSWHSGFDKIKLKLHKLFIFIFGKRNHDKLQKIKHAKEYE